MNKSYTSPNKDKSVVSLEPVVLNSTSQKGCGGEMQVSSHGYSRSVPWCVKWSAHVTHKPNDCHITPCLVKSKSISSYPQQKEAPAQVGGRSNRGVEVTQDSIEEGWGYMPCAATLM